MDLSSIGITLSIFSAIFATMGIQLQYSSSTKSTNMKEMSCWMGNFLVGVSVILGFEALGLAPQMVVASIGGGTAAVFNLVGKKEPLSHLDLLGLTCLFCGICFVCWYASYEKLHNLQQLIQHFFQPAFLMYLLGLGGIYSWSLVHSHQASVRFQLLRNGEKKKIHTLEHYHHHPMNLAATYYTMGSGICASFTVLFMKCTSELILISIMESNQFVYIPSYLILLGMLISFVLHYRWLEMAKKNGLPCCIFSSFQLHWIGFSVLGGAFFSIGNVFSWTLVGNLGSIMFVLIGLYFLARHRHHSTTTTTFYEDTKSTTVVPITCDEIALLEQSEALLSTIPIVEPMENSFTPRNKQYNPPAVLCTISIDNKGYKTTLNSSPCTIKGFN